MNEKHTNLYEIAICDDHASFLDDTQKLVREILEDHKIGYHVDCFSSYISIEEAITQDKERYDIIFLDIQLGGQSGMDLAKKIRGMKVEATIIFITAYAEFAIEGYEVNAFRYLLKPVSKSMLEDVLLLAYERGQETKAKELVIEMGAMIRKIPYGEIQYIEIQGRSTMIQMRKERLATTYKISELEEMLKGSDIIRCHRSFLVNLQNIHMLQRYEASTTTEDTIPISKAYYQNVKNTFMQYLSRKS